MQTRGTIFHHRRLVFHNGFTGKKYLILLNTPSGNQPYLFVKTTSQKKDRPTDPGCLKERSLFFIPSGTTFFKRNTWVQLHELYEIPLAEIDADPDISLKPSLSVKIIDDIVNCLFLCEEENISRIHKELLRPPLDDALRKLKEKFDKKR